MKNSEKFMEKLIMIKEKYPSYTLYITPLMKNLNETEVTFNFKRKNDIIQWYRDNYWECIFAESVPTKVLECLKEIGKIENFNEFEYTLCGNTTNYFDLTTNSNISRYTAFIQKDFEEFSIRFVIDNAFDIDRKRNVDLVVVKNSEEIWKKRLLRNASCAKFFEEIDKHFKATVGKINWIKAEVLRMINQDKLDAEFEKLLG